MIKLLQADVTLIRKSENQQGMGADRKQLPKIPVRYRFSRLPHNDMRRHLRGSGKQHDNLDCYWLYPSVHNEEEYGHYLVDELEEPELSDEVKRYFMYEEYGRDASINDDGMFTEKGYIYNNRNTFSVSDVVVLHQDGQDAAHFVDSVGFREVPEFLQEQKQLTPDDLETGETVKTPRGTFHVTAMSREQIEAAGYGFHHQSDDGKYLIMGNGTRAFAVAAEQAQRDNPLKTAEQTIEQNGNMNACYECFYPLGSYPLLRSNPRFAKLSQKKNAAISKKITTLPKSCSVLSRTFLFALFFDFGNLFCRCGHNPYACIAHTVKERVKLPPLCVLCGGRV